MLVAHPAIRPWPRVHPRPRPPGTARAAAADREPVTVIWQHEFETGDYVEAFLSNETGTVDFDVIHAVLRVD